MRFKMRIAAAALLAAFAPLAPAQTGGTTAPAPNHGQANVAGKIASNFTTLAGSTENALALVNALRNGTDVTLTTVVPPPEGSSEPPTTTTTTFTPPTGKMGWGNVKHALALAQDALAKAGVTNPTAEQLQTALVGGDIVVTNADGTTTTTALRGILTMRSEGMGWGNIAKAGGTKLGPVTSQVKMGKVPTVSSPITAEGASAASASSKGITTASGAYAGHTPKGNAYGRGIVTAAGGGATNVAAANGHGKPAGVGVVNAGGGQASAVSNAGGNAGGNGKGNGKGGGKPGG